jgi:hypothetical protein
MDAITESIWRVVQENANQRGGCVNMARLWECLSDWALDNAQIIQEFLNLEARGLLLILPAESAHECVQLIIAAKTVWRCPNCGAPVDELLSEHIETCVTRQRKMAGWRARAGIAPQTSRAQDRRRGALYFECLGVRL